MRLLIFAIPGLVPVLSHSIPDTDFSPSKDVLLRRAPSELTPHTQYNAGWHLISLSQTLPNYGICVGEDDDEDTDYSEGMAAWDEWEKKKLFTYYSSGEGVTIYMIDTGANTDAPEYTGMKHKPRWVYLDANEEQDDPGDHGSCMLSLLAGPTCGVAKDAEVVILKVPRTDPSKPVTEESIQVALGYLKSALTWIKEDVLRRRGEAGAKRDAGQPAGKEVISLSMQLPAGTSETQVKAELGVVKEIEKLGVPMFTAAGNDRESSPDIDRYIALWASEVKAIIPVGAVTELGHRAHFSQGGPLTALWAVGFADCASGHRSVLAYKHGTSLATAVAAGLGAALLSILGFIDPATAAEDIPAELLRKMQKMSWTRDPFAEDAAISNDLGRLDM